MHFWYLPVGLLCLLAVFVCGKQRWNQGCYEIVENPPKDLQNKTANGDVLSPGYCIYNCSNKSFLHAVVSSPNVCFCLRDLLGLNKLNSSRCNYRCNNSEELSCGGDNAVSVYSTSWPVIFNASISGKTSISSNESCEFQASAWLSSTSEWERARIHNSTTNTVSYVSVAWSIDNIVYKRVNKTVNGRDIRDGFSYWFHDHGLHTVCVNITNAWSGIRKCRSVWVLERVHSLEVVSISGGKHTTEGLYGIAETENIHLDVVVNAGSFADLRFDFGDGSGPSIVKPQHTKTRKNCSCLALLRKTHSYKEKGLFSLNVTAFNRIGKKELVFKDIFAVDGRITGGMLKTKVAIASTTSRVHVISYGHFRYVAYRWEFAGEVRQTTDSFVEVRFPNNAAQYPIKVSIFNNVSKVDVEGIVYIQPKINSVSLRATPVIAAVGNTVRFQAITLIDYIAWNARENYIWQPGDGSSLHGTLTAAIYKYTRHGTFKARVTAKNLANSAVSSFIEIQVYETIQKLDPWYQPFHFGQPTKFFASVERGSNVTFFWDFGDSTRLNGTSRNVQHTYRRPGNYTFTVTAKNRVSQEHYSGIIFVIGFDCVAPHISFTSGSYEQSVASSTKIRLELDVSVNCSVSRQAAYRWKVFKINNGRKLIQHHQDLGVKASVLSQRTLIIPPFSLMYGKYEFVIRVQMKDTILYSEASKRINIISTGLQAVIKGGNERTIGRKSHENITLDASASYDPDSKDSNGLTFLWECRSIGHAEYGSCFKPNTTDGFSWSEPVISFLPKILVNTAETFAFTVTIMKPGFTKVTATQFLVLQNGPLYNINVHCPECNQLDVNSHKVMKFKADCKQCDDNVDLEWKVFFVIKYKVFFRYFGKCISPDGSAWKDAGNANHTNTTFAPATSSLPTTTQLIASPTLVSTTTNASVEVVKDQQRIICVKELEKLRGGFNRLGSQSTSTSYRSARKRRALELGVLQEETDETNDSMLNADLNEQLRKLDLFDYVGTVEDTADQVSSFEAIDTNSDTRFRRDVEQNSAPPGQSQNSTAAAMNVSQIRPQSRNSTGSVTGITGEGSSDSNSAVQSSGSTSVGSGYSGTINRPDNFFQWTGSGGDVGAIGAGTGSGRVPIRGSGSGCDYGTGIGAGSSYGSGGGTTGGCSGHEDKFGEGAKKHKNQTGTDGSSVEQNQNAQKDKKLKEKLASYRQIMNPAKISHSQTSGFNSKEFSIKENTLVPGQFYMVQLTASWKTESGMKLAGQSKTFFTTNTGPFLGTCEVSPRMGYEIHTSFRLSCKHWKDKHFPLKQIVQYKRKSSEKPSYIYSGYKTKLNFILSAGERTNNYTISLLVTVQDTEGVETNLCPIELQVFPATEIKASLEEKIYNDTLKNNSLLKLYEDVSDINSAMVLSSAYASSLNRLFLVGYSSSKYQLRLSIRKGILSSLLTFNIQDDELTHQVICLVKETTNVFQEISLSSVQLSTYLLRRWISPIKKRTLSVELLTEAFQVIANLFAATKHLSKRVLNPNQIRSSVLEIIRIHDDLLRAKKANKNLDSSSSKLETNILSTKTTYHTQNLQGTISIAGCSFSLPRIMPEVIQSRAVMSTGVTSRMTVFENNPYTWANDSLSIDSKVASLVFENSTGSEIRISNLAEPIAIKLPLKIMKTAKNSHTVNILQMKIHGFNVSRESDSSALFIHLQEIDAGENSEHYKLQAVLRFDKAPTKLNFNNTLKFKNKTASINFSPVPEASKVFIGVFIKAIGRETIKKRNLPWFRYSLTIYSGSCLFWNSQKEFWSGAGCKASNESDMNDLLCRCNHLTSFGGHIEFISSSVEVKSILELQENEENHIVLTLVLISIALYLLLIVYFAKIERSLKTKKEIINLPDNHAADSFRYLVITETGCCKGAGTSARVSIVIYGQEGYSQIRELTCNGEDIFQRGSTDCIMISFPDSLGEIRKIRLWHDNGGEAPEWFMKQITIVDCQNENSWYFNLNDWLAIGDRSKVDCELPARKSPVISVIQVMCEGILDYHLWLSVFTRPNRSSFRSTQRLTSCLTILLGYMCALSLSLQRPLLQGHEILGVWDFRWLPVYLGLITMALVFPVRMLSGFILRNCGKSNISSKNEKIDEEDQESTIEGSGALYFLNMLSSKESLEKRDAKQPKNSLGQNSLRTGSLLPSWCKSFCLATCILIAAASAALTILFGMRLNNQKLLLYAQSLILCLSFNIFAAEVVFAIMISLRRIYLLHKRTDVKTYLKLFAARAKSDVQNIKLFRPYDGCELNEKKIMAARDRARFVRFSKPLSGDKLRKAEKTVINSKDLSWFFRELVLLIIYFTTLSTILLDVRITENYRQQLSISETIRRPSSPGVRSFENITSATEFWEWSESRLLDIIRWDCWEHLSSILHKNNIAKDRATERETIYTFGPVRLWKEEHKRQPSKLSVETRNSSHFQNVGSKLLLVGTRDTMSSTLQLLRNNEWIRNTTERIHIDISYYHPESNVFSYVQLNINVPKYGKFITSLNIDVVRLHFDTDAWRIWISVCKIVFLVCVLVSLRTEYCLLMDKGLSHLFKFWSLTEASLIIICFTGVVLNILHIVTIEKLLYHTHTMYLNDKRIFLDLGSLVLYQKMLRLVYSCLLFVVMLKTLKVLCVWNRFANLVAMIQFATSKLSSYIVAVAVIMAALTHSGRLLLGSTTWQFSETRTTIMTLFSLLRRQTLLLDGELDDAWLCRLYKVIALVAVLLLWRLSVVFYLGIFASSKFVGKRRPTIIKTLTKRFKKLKRKQWKILVKHFLPRFFKKREEKYRINELPLENVFEEIEYQVEEVVFRMNNLFNMQQMPDNGDSIQDYDGDTIDSSDDAAYPSSYSTKDSISLASDSIFSEDSGYQRYPRNNDIWQSVYESEEEYEGPVIHYLDGPKQRVSDSGQFLSPIFGGRYFVKTSWSTFRAPKIQPGSIDCRPSTIVRPQKSKSSQTFEKLKQWSSTHGTVNTSDLTPAAIAYENAGFEEEEIEIQVDNETALHEVGPTRIKLPRALDSIYRDLPRDHGPVTDPFKRPPKLSSISNVLAKNRKRRSFKKMQVSPMESDSCSSRSSLRSSGSDFNLPSRSPSLDSGIIRSSETDDCENNDLRNTNKHNISELFEINPANRICSTNADTKLCW